MTGEILPDDDDGPPDTTSVLIVEDEAELADMYAAYLSEGFETEIAYGGEAALDMLSEEFDLILLDRRMPVVSGNEVLAAIEEENIGCRVAMVTAVNPDFDIIDLRIDDYLVKPVTQDELIETVTRLMKLDEYNDRIRQLTSKKLKRNVLEVEKTQAELTDSTEFEELNQEIAELEQEVDALADELDVESAEEV